MKSFFGFFQRKPSSRFPSTIDVLATMLPRKTMRLIQQNCRDRLQTTQVAASILGENLDVITVRLADKMQIQPMLTIDAVNLLPILRMVSLDEMRQLGAVVLCDSQYLHGIACVDPSLIDSLMTRLSPQLDLPIYLSTLGSVFSALDRAEKDRVRRLKDTPSKRAQKEKELAEQVLQLIISEAQSYQAAEVSFDAQGSFLSYTYVARPDAGSPARQTAQGGIDAKIKDAMLDLLSRLAQEGTTALKLQPEDADITVRVLERGVGTSFAIVLEEEEEVPSVGSNVSFIPGGKNSTETRAASHSCEVAVESEPSADGIIEVPSIELSESSEALIEDPAPAYEEAPAPLAAPNEKVILIIDDNQHFAFIVSKVLAKAGLVSAQTNSAKVALEQLQRGEVHPSLVLCDVHMPDMNGIEFAKEFRRLAAHSDTPLYMLTSDDRDDAEIDAVNAGADGYFLKTASPDKLLVHIKRGLSKAN